MFTTVLFLIHFIDFKHFLKLNTILQFLNDNPDYEEYEKMNRDGYCELVLSMKGEEDTQMVSEANTSNFPDGNFHW